MTNFKQGKWVRLPTLHVKMFHLLAERGVLLVVGELAVVSPAGAARGQARTDLAAELAEHGHHCV